MSLRKSEIECQLNFLQKQVAICPAYLTLAYVRAAREVSTTSQVLFPLLVFNLQKNSEVIVDPCYR